MFFVTGDPKKSEVSGLLTPNGPIITKGKKKSHLRCYTSYKIELGEVES